MCLAPTRKQALYAEVTKVRPRCPAGVGVRDSMANTLRYVLQQVVKKGLPIERMLHQTLEKGELGRQLGVKDKEFQAVGALEEAQKYEKGVWSRERWEVGWRAVWGPFCRHPLRGQNARMPRLWS